MSRERLLTCRDHCRIHSHCLAAFRLVHRPSFTQLHLWDDNPDQSPFLPRGISSPLLQQSPIAVQLFLGLIEVAPIGRKSCLFQGHHCTAGGTRKATDEFL